jgi:serine/threonine-protein kinase HipA
MTRKLNIWTNGTLLGTWSFSPQEGHRFRYDDEWAESPAARSLSLSMPLVSTGATYSGKRVLFFFDNLLPDNDAIRARIAAKFRTGSTQTMDLLAAVGRDCAGALQFLTPDKHPVGTRLIRGVPLTPRDVEQEILASLSSASVAEQQHSNKHNAVGGGVAVGAADDNGVGEFRLSIAGAQEKTALLYYERRWQRPLGVTPTTHILKLPLGLVGNMRADMSTSVENEWLCLQFFRQLGLAAPDAKIVTFGSQKVLVVPRFDRALIPANPRTGDGEWFARLPTEDFCQALGISGHCKYESEGGPGMGDIMRILDTGSRPLEDKRAFLTACILFWMLGATDGHGKNFSLFHERGGSHRLAPFYDVLSAWPIVGNDIGQLPHKRVRLAMAVRSKNPHWKHAEILPRHWETVAKRHGFSGVREILVNLVDAVPAAVSRLKTKLPDNYPEWVASAIFGGIARSVEMLKSTLRH